MNKAFVNPVIDNTVRELCCRPYYNHKKGCPNYNKRDMCPPKAPLLYEYFNMTKPIIAIWSVFSLEVHREKMKVNHPKWSTRQLDCCLYWQSTLLKNLRKDVNCYIQQNSRNLFGNHSTLITTYVPEAMGVNVTATMKIVGVLLEWPPKKRVMKIAFVGTKNAN